MAVFKRKYNYNGSCSETSRYHIRFRDHIGISRQLPAFDNKKASEKMLNNIQNLVSVRIADQTLTKELQSFIDELSSDILAKLIQWDIIRFGRTSAAAFLNNHIEDFRQSLLDKGRTKHYVQTTVPRVEKIVEKCKFIKINDINIDIVQHQISELQISDQTKRHYVRSLKQFSSWLYHSNRTSTDILSRLVTPSLKEIVRNRRALTAKEVAKLLKVTKNSDTSFYNVSGYERYLIYSLALSTGLRANEIRTLTVIDFDFIHHTVTVRPKNEKARRGATLPLQKELSIKIKDFTKYKTPAARALSLPSKTSEMLQADLAQAGIEYKTDQGYADFHSLRHTFGTILAKSGAAPQIAQKLMRHSDPRLTQNYYTHLLVDDLRSATDKIPVFDSARPDCTKASVSK
jgi:integrase/recombinase XerC